MTAADTPDFDPLADLLDTLDLEELGTARITVEGVGDGADFGESGATVFLGRSQKMPHGRVFGGQVLAQCVMAAGRTMADIDDGDGPRRIHSLHGYFMRPGDDTKPIRFAVERMRDGNSFSTRRVHAIQDGLPILSMITSFQEASGGLDHQDPMPRVPLPGGAAVDDRPVRGDRPPRCPPPAQAAGGAPARRRQPVRRAPARTSSSHQSVWLKAVGALPDDPLVHAAVLAYASDYTLLEAVLRRHGLTWTDRRLRPASLDHAMWFHRPVRADDWMLYAQESPVRVGRAGARHRTGVRRRRDSGRHGGPGGHGPRQGVLTR